MQQRQMCTQEGDNVFVCAVKGNFDDAQTGVKTDFLPIKRIGALLDERNMLFSSANSINWGRLLPQVVYYFIPILICSATERLNPWKKKINIAVPTGNFGNILAAYYASKWGFRSNVFSAPPIPTMYSLILSERVFMTGAGSSTQPALLPWTFWYPVIWSACYTCLQKRTVPAFPAGWKNWPLQGKYEVNQKVFCKKRAFLWRVLR